MSDFDVDSERRSPDELRELLDTKINDLAIAYLDAGRFLLDARDHLAEDPEQARYLERLANAAGCAAIAIPAVVKDPFLKGGL